MFYKSAYIFFYVSLFVVFQAEDVRALLQDAMPPSVSPPVTTKATSSPNLLTANPHNTP